MTEVETLLAELLKGEYSSASIEFNRHKSYYRTVAQAIEAEDHGYEDDCWISADERQRAIDADTCWAIQWYPDTPVGFHMASASTLSALIAHLKDPA